MFGLQFPILVSIRLKAQGVRREAQEGRPLPVAARLLCVSYRSDWTTLMSSVPPDTSLPNSS